MKNWKCFLFFLMFTRQNIHSQRERHMEIGLDPLDRRTFFFSIVWNNKLRGCIKEKIEQHGGCLIFPQPNGSVDIILADKENVHCSPTTLRKISKKNSLV